MKNIFTLILLVISSLSFRQTLTRNKLIINDTILK